MKSDPRYTSESVFDTFPWPQAPTQQAIRNVAFAARKVLDIRKSTTEGVGGNLRALYETLDLPGKNALRDAHLALDVAVVAAYGFNPKNEILSELMALNESINRSAQRGKNGQGPGIPKSYAAGPTLLSDDCLGV